MKTTVYAVRDEHGTRISYCYRKQSEAMEILRSLERMNHTSLSVYKTTQDLPRQYNRKQ